MAARLAYLIAGHVLLHSWGGKGTEVTDDNVVEGFAYMGAGEAARILEVSPKTVSRWADKGLIPCVTTLGGHRRFHRSAVERIRQEMYGAPDPTATTGAARPDEAP